MPKISYSGKRFSAAHLLIIERANSIIAEYQRQGYDLTLRQLYYQFVARDLIPNKQTEYKRLGSIVNDGRLAGLIDWKALVDRTRNLQRNAHWTNPDSIVRSAAVSYRLDRWEGQTFRVEVWVEKEALAGVVERVATRLDLDYFSCRGYVSQSEMWRAARRHLEYERAGQSVVVLHLGDHDPSGIDMTRDIADRLELFGASTDVRRIALNRDQIDEYAPPPNPTKLSDSRSTGYVDLHGYSSWELDALDPATLAALIEDETEPLRNEDLYGTVLQRENEDLELLNQISGRMDEVKAALGL